MKKILLLVLVLPWTLSCKTHKTSKEKEPQLPIADKVAPPPPLPLYTYDSLAGDPLKTRIYRLPNGLTVYMSVNKTEPRIQTYIATRVGSRNDPADATGLAHYLEHLLFKGTDTYGTRDYTSEKVFLSQIEDLYETYRGTADEASRKLIYHKIDSISGLAAKYSIANEYDKMMSLIGGSGSNAHTDFEETVYEENIPSNQVDNWAKIQGERFRNPVLRLFHTELEAVYEEKNISLDTDGDKVFDNMFNALFPTHPYGTRTTIGTIEHLKNPSIKKIREFYEAWYVPNNMAVCMAGDFNPDSVIAILDKRLGKWSPKTIPAFTAPEEKPLQEPVVREVVGPDAENVTVAFRFAGENSADAYLLRILEKLLSNGTAGLIDLDVNQKQTALDASAFSYVLNDYSLLVLSGSPKEKQKPEQVKDLLLAELNRIKKGDFPEWMMSAVINNIKAEEMRSNESNQGRASSMYHSFITRESWAKKVNRVAELEKITRQQVIDFANATIKNNYVVVYKRTGEDKDVPKVIKPAITPVETNSDQQSDFVKEISASSVPVIEPVFLDYKKDIRSWKINNAVEIFQAANTQNDLFNLYYVYDMGSANNRKFPLALNYLNYLGTGTMSAEQLKQEFYKIGCSYNAFSSNDKMYLMISGLSQNIRQAMELFESLLAEPRADDKALKNLVDDILKSRKDQKLNSSAILYGGMYSYALYGPHSPFTNILSETELRQTKAKELTDIIRSFSGYEHHFLYYGANGPKELNQIFAATHKISVPFKTPPAAKKFVQQPFTKNRVYVVDYDMKQAEIMHLAMGDTYDPSLVPKISLYNEYFSGNMQSVVFQTMRESKALAYSAYSGYNVPSRPENHAYNNFYIGTQADKLPEAMEGMRGLLTDMPKIDVLFASSKGSLLQKLRTERVKREGILFSYEAARTLGLDHDIRRDIYEQAQNFTYDDIKAFQEKYVRNKNTTTLVIGNKKLLDAKTLAKYGEVKYLSLREVFGY